MYCQECGYRIDDAEALYCPECGYRIEARQDVPIEAIPDTGTHASGFIFTNVKALALKLETDEAEIRDILKSFMLHKLTTGVSYKLVDVGQKETHVDVQYCMEVLTDVYDQVTDKTNPMYLFIIGGEDIIPMPCIRHYVENVTDKTIDTDILYSYPYGKNMQPKLEDLTIYQLEQAFLVGRLPIGNDVTTKDLCQYLNRDIEYSGGIPLREAYGQCDPNWKNVSATVADDMITNGMFRNLDDRLTDDYYFRRLILSPQITIGNVGQVFHTGASLYYFNLHGSNALESRGYFGAPLRQKQTYPVLLPEHLKTCQAVNIVVSEACYGARFIGLDKSHSMLLSSIYNKTLVFLGSSRIAWGSVDSDIQAASPMLADTIAAGFMRAVQQGYTAGEALYLARSMVFGQDSDGCPNTVATVAEFNLFGDPTLKAFTSIATKGKTCPTIGKKAYVTDKKRYQYKTECIDTSHCNKILQLVRRAVDKNILQIQGYISNYLYEQYGIEARQANSIIKMKYSNGNTELRFNYDIYMETEISMSYTVITTEEGKIKNTIMTK